MIAIVGTISSRVPRGLQAPAQASAPRLLFRWGIPCFMARVGPWMKIQLVNLLLTLVTFGFYSFWAKVKVRKYFYNETEIGGDRFDYYGTGKELMIVWLKVSVVFIVVFGAMGAMQVIWRGPMSELLGKPRILRGVAVPGPGGHRRFTQVPAQPQLVGGVSGFPSEVMRRNLFASSPRAPC